MLAKRIIPTLLVRGSELFKGVGYSSWRRVGHVAQAVRIHQARGVDELVILDISATEDGRKPDTDLVFSLSTDCFSPLTVGGGIRSLDDVKALMDAGADKVAICTAAAHDTTLIPSIADRYGSQAVVAILEVRYGKVTTNNGTMEWVNTPAQMAQVYQKMGAGEILVSCVERDGTMAGYDLPLIESVSKAVSVPVVAMGGCSGSKDMYDAIKAGADAVSVGALFQFTDTTPKDCAIDLQNRGIEVRL